MVSQELRWKYSLLGALIVVVLLISSAKPIQAQGTPPPLTAATNARIDAVESSLLPEKVAAGTVAASKMTLADRMAFYHVPGVSIAVINNGQIEWAKGYGLLKAGSDAAVTTTTLFQAASVSKTIAATTALRLVQQGKLTLDDNVNQWLTSWKVPDSALTQQQPVTLRELLSHSAGFNVHGFDGYPSTAKLPSLIQVLNGQPPANSPAIVVDVLPGSEFRYSGGGFVVLEQLIKDVNPNESFVSITKRLVLDPIGMTNSTYQQPLPAQLSANAAVGHTADGKPLAENWHVYPEQSAAGLWTSPSDMALWAIQLQNADAGQADQILTPQTVQDMLTVQKGSWGLGVGLGGKGNGAFFWHDGVNDGYRAFVVGFLHTGQGAVILTNSDNGDKLYAEILRAIALVYKWPAYEVQVTKAAQ